jgi:thymidylate kinase
MTNNFIKLFLAELDVHNINYVHWKGNAYIDKALENIDDLDILVDLKDNSSIKSIFSKLSIIRGYSYNDKWTKNVYHYIGLDTDSLQLVHIHLHYNLVVGHDYDESIALPVVNNYLQERYKEKDIFIPKVEKEYIILIIRLLMKYSYIMLLLFLPVYLRKRKSILQKKHIKELEYLTAKINRESLSSIIKKEFSIFTYTEFSYYESVIKNNNSLYSFFIYSLKLRKQLAKYKLHSELSSFFLSVYRMIGEQIRHFNIKRKKLSTGCKLPANGGRIIAFVGGDGSGKTTNIKSTYKMFSKQFATEKIHVGRPNRSFCGFIVQVISKLFSIIGCKLFAKALGYLSVAINRKYAFNRAVKLRNKGKIILLDRIPLQGITAMDCPRIHTVANGKYKRLSKIEQKIYEDIKGIDLLFVLKLNPHIALKRRPEDNPEELLVRSGQIWNSDYNAHYAIEINTGENTQEQVLQMICKNIWENLNTPYIRTELVGLNGTGKSTITKKLADIYPNIKLDMSVKQYPCIYAKNFILKLPQICMNYFKTKQILPARTLLYLYTQLDIMRKAIKNNRFLNTNLIADQGILFVFAFLLKENFISDKMIVSNSEVIRKYFPKLIYITATKEVLWERVNNRPKQAGRALNYDYEGFCKFCEDYENAVEIVLENQNVIRLDSSKMSVDEIIEVIKKLNGQELN